MISFLEGDVAERSGTRVVISVGGVGYDVQVPASTLAKLPPVGRPARVYTRLVVRDDAMTLFGFANADERELFDLLVTVSGIGPKVALSFLSVLSPDAFRRAVSSGDFFVAMRATIAARAAPSAAAYAAALPPPGTGASEARSSLNERSVRSTSRSAMGACECTC